MNHQVDEKNKRNFVCEYAQPSTAFKPLNFCLGFFLSNALRNLRGNVTPTIGIGGDGGLRDPEASSRDRDSSLEF